MRSSRLCWRRRERRADAAARRCELEDTGVDARSSTLRESMQERRRHTSSFVRRALQRMQRRDNCRALGVRDKMALTSASCAKRSDAAPGQAWKSRRE
jgi:hypothetical protein